MEEDGARVVNKRTNFALWKRARSREGRGRRQESARDCVGMVLTLRYLSALDVYRILNMLSSPGEPISGAARYGKFGVEAGDSSAAEVSLQRPDGALRETVVWSGGFTTRVRSTRCDGATDCPAGSGSDCSNSRQKQQGAETAELDETGGITSTGGLWQTVDLQMFLTRTTGATSVTSLTPFGCSEAHDIPRGTSR